MTENVALWVIGEAVAFIIIGIGAYISLLKKQADDYNQVSTRLVKIETTLEILGVNAAKILHSPHDPFKLDRLLDLYIDRHYEMQYEEWEQLLLKCEEVMNNQEVGKDYRLLAGTLAAVCHHKLKHDPDDKMKSKAIL